MTIRLALGHVDVYDDRTAIFAHQLGPTSGEGATTTTRHGRSAASTTWASTAS
ncbi:hypothetical protein OG948_56825 (plasmid) [Embleya sp. NBC_00888]|uniref:hypothetical protein n=1 Tax=Embleya sp. NBC_00888 TaxID=2975960 RepID=UPI002F918327|nr:hypothetical protein OG948_56825 [Embleya sp. NBC_00888]